MTVDDFFEENLVQNLAALLGIDKSRIRVMNVISADSSRRRRSTDDMVVEVEIGDPPATTIEYDEPELYDNSTVSNTTEGYATNQNYTGIVSKTHRQLEKSYIG